MEQPWSSPVLAGGFLVSGSFLRGGSACRLPCDAEGGRWAITRTIHLEYVPLRVSHRPFVPHGLVRCRHDGRAGYRPLASVAGPVGMAGCVALHPDPGLSAGFSQSFSTMSRTLGLGRLGNVDYPRIQPPECTHWLDDTLRSPRVDVHLALPGGRGPPQHAGTPDRPGGPQPGHRWTGTLPPAVVRPPGTGYSARSIPTAISPSW